MSDDQTDSEDLSQAANAPASRPSRRSFLPRFGLRTLFVFAILPILSFADEPAPASEPEAPTAWRRSTEPDAHRPLEIRTNDFSGVYEVGQPIPVAVEIRNPKPPEGEQGYPFAALQPWLDVWVRSASGEVLSHKQFDPKIENRIVIDAGEAFVVLLDVREALDLKLTGEYRISVGHDNLFVSSIGDWTGTLASHERIVRIQDAKAASK